jgi:hypothetical protein
MTLSNRTYDILKWVITIVLPATATLVAALSAIYGWAWGEAAVVALTTFLGSIFMVSSKSYQKVETRAGREIVAEQVRNSIVGEIHASEDPGGITYTLEPKDDDLDKIAEQEFVAFRVVRD